MPDRHTADTITDDKLDRLYAKLHKARKRRDEAVRRADNLRANLDALRRANVAAEREVTELRYRIRLAGPKPPSVSLPMPPAAAMPPAAVNGIWAAHRREGDRADKAEAALDHARRTLASILAKPGETPLDELTEYAAKTLTRNGERLIDAEKRAEQVEAERDELHAALSLAPGQLHSAALSAIHGRGANIRELAARSDAAEQRLARIRDMADNWERRLPATIRTATAAEAVRNAANGDDRPVMFAVTPAPADGDQPAAPPVPDAYRAPAGDPRAVLDRIRDARQWADVQAQLGMYYGWTAEQSGQRARAYRLAADSLTAAAERNADEAGQDAERFKADCLAACKTIADMHEAATGRTGMGPIRGVIEDVADVRTERDEAARLSHEYRNRAETAEQRLAAANRARDEQAAANRARDEQAATIRRLVNRTASLERQLAERRKTLSDADTLGHKLLQRAENAEGRCTALERQLADMRKAYKDADARATLQGQRAVRYLDGACEAEAAADRYKTAWRSARKRARVLSSELTRRAPLNGQYAAEAGRLRAALRATEDDLADARRRLAQQATPQMCQGPEPVNANHPLHDLSAALRAGVQLDDAHARNLIGRYWQAIHDRYCTRQHETPDTAETDDTVHACPGRWGGPQCRCFNDEPADGPSLRAQLAAMADRANRPASLATPCAYCAHPYNWHASRGACEFGNETNRCGCNTFTPGEPPPPMNPLHILGIDARPETP